MEAQADGEHQEILEERPTPESKRSARRDEASGEWFEDAESDADWVESLSLAGTDIFLDNTPAAPPSNITLEELHEKNALLEDKLKETEKLLQQTQTENERLNAQ